MQALTVQGPCIIGILAALLVQVADACLASASLGVGLCCCVLTLLGFLKWQLHPRLAKGLSVHNSTRARLITTLCADNNNGPSGWLRLFVEQAGGQAAVSLVQVRTSNSGAAWTSLNNVYGSDWEIQNSPAYPLDVSIVGPDGQTVRFVSCLRSLEPSS